MLNKRNVKRNFSVTTEQFYQDLDSLVPLQEDILDLAKAITVKIINDSPEKNTTRLFHYTSAQGLSGIISNSNLWATDYRFLNDSREMKDGLDIAYKALSSQKIKLLRDFAEYLLNHSEKLNDYTTPYITSFCSESDLLSQWRAYANQSEGYCVEFDFSDSELMTFEKDTVVICNLAPVIYDDKLKVSIIEFTIEKTIEILKNHGIGVNTEDLSDSKNGIILGMLSFLFQIPVLTFKDQTFSEEKEWRAMFLLNVIQNEELRNYRISGGSFIPYITSSFFQRDEDSFVQRTVLPIKSVCLPPAAGSVTRKGIELFLKDNGFRDNNEVTVLNSKIPLRNQKNINW